MSIKELQVKLVSGYYRVKMLHETINYSKNLISFSNHLQVGSNKCDKTLYVCVQHRSTPKQSIAYQQRRQNLSSCFCFFTKWRPCVLLRAREEHSRMSCSGFPLGCAPEQLMCVCVGGICVSLWCLYRGCVRCLLSIISEPNPVRVDPDSQQTSHD